MTDAADQTAPELPSDATLGQHLRAARTARGLSINSISQETKIGNRFLEAIERDDFTALPGGLFNRAFVRAFAREVGVAEDHAMALYERAMGEWSIGSDRDGPTNRELAIVGGGALLAVLLALALWLF